MVAAYGHPPTSAPPHAEAIEPAAYYAAVRALEFHRARATSLAALASELLANHQHRAGEWKSRLDHLIDDRVTPTSGGL